MRHPPLVGLPSSSPRVGPGSRKTDFERGNSNASKSLRRVRLFRVRWQGRLECHRVWAIPVGGACECKPSRAGGSATSIGSDAALA